MIKVTGLNKYYNKGKNNELHVINDVTLEFNENGLIAFLGKSGSGKTTLLNVIGGLDKQDSGEITYNEQLYKKYNMGKMDAYRKEKIGYIFQNYLLIENLSVMDNLRIALDIIGIKNTEEQDKRIEYALKMVGLYKHRKKLAGRLSGGEMQRVSIARSLIKNCEVIIADEPTGNLDSENTLEIMNILKQISKNTLVLLVTHNEEIASAFADRLIRIKDGTIVEDKINDVKGTLTNKSDKKIHLKDLHNETVKNNQVSLNLYTDEEDLVIDLKMVIKNDIIYIDTNKKIVSTSEAGISLIDDHLEQKEKTDESKMNFDISWFDDTKEHNFLLELGKSLKNSFKQFYFTKRRSKIFQFIFFLIGIIIAACVVTYTNYKVVDNSAYINEDAYLIYRPESSSGYYIDDNGLNRKELIADGYIQDIYDYDKKYYTLDYQMNSSLRSSYSFSFYMYPIRIASDCKILAGQKPLKADEIMLSKKIADYILKKENFSKYDDLTGYKIRSLMVSGVNDSDKDCIYTSDLYYLWTLATYNDNNLKMISSYITNQYIGYKDEITYKLLTGNDLGDNLDDILLSESIATHYNLKAGDQVTMVVNNDITGITTERIFNVAGTFWHPQERDKCKYGMITNDPSMLKYRYVISQNNTGLSLYLNLPTYQDILALVSDFNYVVDNPEYNFQLISGKLPEKDDELIVSAHLPVSAGNSFTINAQTYKIVGTYITDDALDNINVVLGTKKASLFSDEERISTFFNHSSSYALNNVPELRKRLNQEGFEAKLIYDHLVSFNEELNRSERLAYLIMSIILLVAGMIYVYFSTRSRLLNNVKDIGVYRSIGKTRFQIIKTYISDIFVETSLTSILGYVLAILTVLYLNSKIITLTGEGFVTVDHGYYFLGALMIYLINIFFGLIPVMRLMMNTPSEINSKYDI